MQGNEAGQKNISDSLDQEPIHLHSTEMIKPPNRTPETVPYHEALNPDGSLSVKAGVTRNSSAEVGFCSLTHSSSINFTRKVNIHKINTHRVNIVIS